MHLRASALVSVLFAATVAGCMGSAGESVQAGGNVGDGTRTVSSARFEIRDLAIVHADGAGGPFREDDGIALVRFTIHEPADAPASETAFVTYLLNGRIVDVLQLTLEPGASRAFERTIADLRATRDIDVEVRAAAQSQKASASVVDWPRAGQDTAELGPMRIRIDYGLMEQDGRVLVNFTLENAGPGPAPADFRAKMLCALPNGTVRATSSVRLPAPAPGEQGSIDALLDDCGNDLRYGVEIKARGHDADLVARLLLVPVGWRP